MLKSSCTRAVVVAVAGVVCVLASANGQSVEKQKDGKFAPEMRPVRSVEQALYNAEQMERFIEGMKGGAQPIVASNDLCASAIALTLGTPEAGSTTDATVDPGAGAFCGTSISAPGVWYSIDGTGNTMTASLCTGTSYDSKISIFCGSCSSLTCIAGNDDACSVQSQVSWCSDAGTTYLVLVHGFSSNVGDFEIVVTDNGTPCVGAVDCSPVVGGDNDLCDDATPLGPLPAMASGTTTGATPDSDVSANCGTSITAPGVWYSFDGTGTQVTASLCGSSYDTKISVFTGTCDAPVCVAGNDDLCSLQSEVSFCANLGLTYYVLVHGYQSNSGNFTLNVTDSGVPCECEDLCLAGDLPEGEPECYDEYDDQFNGGCNSVVPVFSDIACGDTVCGTSGTFLFTDPVFGLSEYRDTDWYRVSLASGQVITWRVTGNFPTLLGIVDTGGIDDCGGVTDFLTSGVADPCAEGVVSALVPAGTWYLFVAPADFSGVACGSEYRATLECADPPTGACCLGDGSCADDVSEPDCDAAGGEYQGDDTTCGAVSCPQPQGNDLCEDAVGPLSVPSSTLGTTSGATTDSFDFDCGAALVTSPGVWYTTIGTGNTMTASLCSGTSYDSKLSVFCGTCDAPVCIDGNDDSCGLQSEVSWCSQPGAEYLILVHGYGGQTGAFELALTDDGTPCSGGVQCLPEGACCFPGHVCTQTTEDDCAAQGGVYAGDGVLCAGAGYELTDCNSAFEDISGTGTEIILGDEEHANGIPLGFTFTFYGMDWTDINVDDNGFLSFEFLSGFTYSNQEIPDTDSPNNLIAPYWDDLDTGEVGASVHYQTLGTAPNRRFIAQWTNVPQFFDVDSNTFQAVLYEGSNAIEFRYGVVSGPGFTGDVTIGLESPGGLEAVVANPNVSAGDCYHFEFSERPDPCNSAPDCTTDGVVSLWPPNHQAVAIDVAAVAGVTDPDGDPVTLTITSITQDEPINGTGDGNTTCDGGWSGTTAYIRPERQGGGNGRVYRINYTACDDAGVCCDGYIEVHVPHSGNGNPAIDDGQIYDSTPCFGKTDVNADGLVDTLDLEIVSNNYGMVGPDEYLNWPDGDVNADARVDVIDLYKVLLQINANGGMPRQPQSQDLDSPINPHEEVTPEDTDFTRLIR